MPGGRPKKRAKLHYCKPSEDSGSSLQPSFDSDEFELLFDPDEYDGEAVKRIIQKYPSAAKTIIYGDMFPLHCIILLISKRKVSYDVIETVYRAFPHAAKIKLNDRTPLHIALSAFHLASAHHTSLDVISLLLEGWPASVAEQDEDGWTPLHYAVGLKSPAGVVSFMMDKCPEAALQKENRNGETPLHLACRDDGPLELATILLEKNPLLVQEKTTIGLTPLHCACYNNVDIELVSLLLNTHPAGLAEKAVIGVTPLHIACKYGKLDLVRLLLERYPAAAAVKDIKGRTPLHAWKIEGRTHCNRFQFREGRIILEGISELVENNVDELRAWHILIDFAAIEWWRGAMLVFDLFPPAMKKLDKFPLTMIPSILSSMGRHCHLTTMWDTIINRQDLLNIS